MLESGAGIRHRCGNMGHSTKPTFMNLSSHVSEGVSEQAAEALVRLLGEGRLVPSMGTQMRAAFECMVAFGVRAEAVAEPCNRSTGHETR